MSRVIDKIKSVLSGSEYEKLIKEAEKFPRYTPHSFNFRGLDLTVTDFISVAWQLNEIFADEEMKFASQKKNPLIIDCGSNVGVSVIYFKKLFPESRVLAFEPDPVLSGCLKKNLLSNNIKGAEVFEKAVWINENGVSFGSDGADGGSVFLEQNKITLPSVRLKNILSNEESVDFLKMDIEGAEVDVLLDCGSEISKVKNIFVEYHSWQHLPQRLDVLLQLLSSNGFRYYIRSIGRKINPFIDRSTDNGMDIQMNIQAIKM